MRSWWGQWWRTLGVAYWLGWQIESNWTDPFLFLAYSIVRPLSATLILVLIFYVITEKFRGPMLGFFVIGNAFWPLVIAGMQGMVWGFIADRDQWNTLRYIHSSRASMHAYLIGRSLAQLTPASAAVLVVLGLGWWPLRLPLHFDPKSVYYLLVGLALGIVSIVSLGVLATSAAMLASGEAWQVPEGVGASLYLLCGAIFPVHLLPNALQILAYGLPLTWWLEVIRRALLGSEAVRSFPWATDMEVLGIFALVTVGFLLFAGLAFSWADRRARALGILDYQSAY